jgi:cyanophycinase
VDLVSWQRAARARASSQFPPSEPETPEVANGTSIMVGGGRVGKEILDRFLEAAGGPEAPIVVVPTANGAAARRLLRMLEDAGAQNLRVFHAAHPSEVPGAENLDFLREARGVWFGGGRQWRLVDAYEGTEAEVLFHRVLDRGGVIAGSSAGCSIQAGYMVRGNPLGNGQISAEGYERGFGFVPGVAVDQHFSQRDRFDDMTELIRQYPQLLGFGVDESTAIAVRGHVLEVLGEGRVAVYDYLDHAPEREGEGNYRMLEPGTRYDLKERRVLDRE